MSKKKIEQLYGARILADGYEVSNDAFATRLNGNDLIVGSSGAGKTGSYVTPNLIRAEHSLVVADTKGLLCRKYRQYLEDKGFRVVNIDFVHTERSATYNILDGVEWYKADIKSGQGTLVKKGMYRQKDLKKIGRILIPEETEKNERFWPDAARSVIISLMAYVLEVLDVKERHMGSVMRLYQALTEEVAFNYTDKAWQGVSFFEELDAEDPDSFAVRMYKMYKGNFKAEKCWSSIIQFVANALEPFTYSELRPLYEGRSTLDLADLGREKTVLFVNISDTDRSMDQIINVFYTQLFQALCSEADAQYDGRLKVPVRIILDDFASNVFIPDFDKIISTIRSRQISASIILQSLSQLEGMYDKADADTIINNCDHKMFFGGQEPDTAKYLADMVGCLPESIMNMDFNRVWIIERGSAPRQFDIIAPYSMDKVLHEKAIGA